MIKSCIENILQKQNFTPMREKVFALFCNGFNHNYRKLDYYWDEDLYFGFIFRKITGINFVFKQNKNISIKTGILKYITAGCYIDKQFFSGHSEAFYNIDDKDLNSKAKGEFLERFSTRFDLDKLFKELKNIKSCEQFSFNNFVKKEKRKYLYCKSLLNFSYKKFDFDRVYYGYGAKSSLKYFKYQPTTNACAGHFDYNEAVLNAWLEAIQRDAFMVYWLNTISPTEIKLSKVLDLADDNLIKIIKILKTHLDIEIKFFDIMSDIRVPVLLCAVTLNSGSKKIVSFGSSSGFDIDAIFLKALQEALSIAVYNIDKESPDLIIDDDYKPFCRFDIDKNTRINMYKNGDNIDKLDFILNTNKVIDILDYKKILKREFVYLNNSLDSLQYLKKLFKNRSKKDPNFDVYIYNFKNKLLKAFDYKVVRIIIPGLYSIYLNESFANPKHPRLIDFVNNQNLQEQAKLNTHPHPFP